MALIRQALSVPQNAIAANNAGFPGGSRGTPLNPVLARGNGKELQRLVADVTASLEAAHRPALATTTEN
jgi:hypothetical protein